MHVLLFQPLRPTWPSKYSSSTVVSGISLFFAVLLIAVFTLLGFAICAAMDRGWGAAEGGVISLRQKYMLESALERRTEPLEWPKLDTVVVKMWVAPLLSPESSPRTWRNIASMKKFSAWESYSKQGFSYCYVIIRPRGELFLELARAVATRRRQIRHCRVDAQGPLLEIIVVVYPMYSGSISILLVLVGIFHLPVIFTISPLLLLLFLSY